VRVLAQKTPSQFQSTVSEVCLEKSIRYPLVPPLMHWSESTKKFASSHDDPIVTTLSLPVPDCEMVTEAVNLTTVTNASVYLTGGRHAVQASDGTLVSVDRVPDKRLAEIPWQSHQHLAGTSLLLGNSAGSSCYYHWMLDLLPKIGYLEKAGIDINSINHFLVREAVTPFQIESLRRLGIDKSRIVETARKPYMKCDEVLLVPLKHHVNLTMHRFVPDWVNASFGDSNITFEQPAVRKNIYIKRPANVRRAIKNADEVESLLISRGFECVVMEGLSIVQQAILLAQADVVIAQHGGALTNMVFSQPGTKIVELFGTHVYPFYFGLANLCNLEYHAILQSPDDYACLVQLHSALQEGSKENISVTQHEEFSVDLVVLEKAIELVLA